MTEKYTPIEAREGYAAAINLFRDLAPLLSEYERLTQEKRTMINNHVHIRSKMSSMAKFFGEEEHLSRHAHKLHLEKDEQKRQIKVRIEEARKQLPEKTKEIFDELMTKFYDNVYWDSRRRKKSH